MLNSLPRLSSRTCTNVPIRNIGQLVDIASQSTLEELHMDCTRMRIQWIGHAMSSSGSGSRAEEGSKQREEESDEEQMAHPQQEPE